MLGIQARPESIAALRHELGLDRPLWEQYLRLCRERGHVRSRGLAEVQGQRVASLLPERLEVSLALIAYATVLTDRDLAAAGDRLGAAQGRPLRSGHAAGADGDAGDAGLLGRHPLPHLLQHQARSLPRRRLRRDWQEHLHHLFLPALTIALEHHADAGPRAAGQHPGGDGIGLRAHGAGQGSARAGRRHVATSCATR